MKPVLLVGAAPPEQAWLQGPLQPLRRRDPLDACPDCAGLVVVDDGGERGEQRLRSALQLRELRPQLPLAVLREIDPSWSRAEALARGLSWNGVALRRLRTLFSESDTVDVRVLADAVLFEYQP